MCSMLQMFLLKTDLHCCVYPKEIISENDSTCPCFVTCFCIVLYALFLTGPALFLCTGATSAPCLIFIFPAVFYIRIVPKDKEPMNSVPKILVRPLHLFPFIHSYVNLLIVLCDTGFCHGIYLHTRVVDNKAPLSLLCF